MAKDRHAQITKAQQRIADQLVAEHGLIEARAIVAEYAGEMLEDGEPEGFKYMQGVFEKLTKAR